MLNNKLVAKVSELTIPGKIGRRVGKTKHKKVIQSLLPNCSFSTSDGGACCICITFELEKVERFM